MQADKESDGAAELTLRNLGGVFLVLVVGCAGTVFIAFAELLLNVIRRSYKNHSTIKSEIFTEFKFLIKCTGQERPNPFRKSLSLSPQQSNHSLKSLDDNMAPTYGFINPELKKRTSETATSRRQSKLT